MSPKRPARLSFFTYNPRTPIPEETLPVEETPPPALELLPEIEQAVVQTPIAALDEAALVERARTDPVAFGQLYERYIDRVYSYIYHRVGNVQDGPQPCRQLAP